MFTITVQLFVTTDPASNNVAFYPVPPGAQEGSWVKLTHGGKRAHLSTSRKAGVTVLCGLHLTLTLSTSLTIQSNHLV